MARAITPLAQQIAEMELHTGMTGSLNGGVARLYQVGLSIDQFTTFATINAEQADYDGYAASAALVPLAGGTNGAGLVEVPYTSVQFVPTGTTTPNSIGGWFLGNAANNQWFASAPLASPRQIAVTGLEQIAVELIARFRQQGVVWRVGTQVTLLEVLTAAMGMLDGAILKLFKDGYSPSEDSTFAEIEAQECDFTGYAQQVVADWNEAGTDPEGFVVLPADTLQFLATGTAVSNMVGGYYVVNAADDTLMFAALLDAPFAMGVTGVEQLPVEAKKTFGM